MGRPSSAITTCGLSESELWQVIEYDLRRRACEKKRKAFPRKRVYREEAARQRAAGRERNRAFGV